MLSAIDRQYVKCALCFNGNYVVIRVPQILGYDSTYSDRNSKVKDKLVHSCEAAIKNVDNGMQH